MKSVLHNAGSLTGHLGQKAEHEDMSILMNGILKEICENKDLDYSDLEKRLSRERNTLRQSVKSLMSRRLVIQRRFDEKHPKSRLVFQPTARGVSFALVNLKIDYEQFYLNYEDFATLKPITTVIENPVYRRLFFIEYCKALLNGQHFSAAGSLSFSSSIDEIKFLISVALQILLEKIIPEENFLPEIYQHLTPEGKSIFRSNLTDLRNLCDSVLGKLGK